MRAWAIYSRGGVIPRHALTTSCLCVSPKRGKFLVGPGERVIRVTIVPDGTPSQAAEVRRLRKLLRKVAPFVGWTGCPDGMRDEIDAALRGRRGR